MPYAVEVNQPLTEPQQRALRVLSELAGTDRSTTPRDVALALWPDSEAWTKRTRGRRTGTIAGAVGGTMPMKAARVLWALNERGLADKEDRDSNLWFLTPLGEQVLAGTAEPKPKPVRVVPEPVIRQRKPPRQVH